MDDYVKSGHGLTLDYADFLSTFPWDIYSTITFRQKRVDSIYWSKRIFEVLSKFDATRAFVACESHRLDGIHFHILSRHLPCPESLSPLWKYCFKAFGRSKIEFVGENNKSELSVSRYCAKYVVKGNRFEFMGDSSAWKFDH